MEGSKRARRLIVYILALVANKENKLIRTQLIKMLFLIDYESQNKLLHTLTGYTYTKNNNGPYTSVFMEDLERLKPKYVSENPRHTANGMRVYYLYDLLEEIKPEEIINIAEEHNWFSQEEKGIIINVVEKYADKELDDILNEVYDLTGAGEKRHGEAFELNENHKKIKNTCTQFPTPFTKQFVEDYKKRYAYTDEEKEILDKERKEMLQVSGLINVS